MDRLVENRKILSLSLVLTLACCSLTQAQETESESEGMIALPPVVVTATKREQALDEVKGAVSVRSGEQLREAGITQVLDLERVFPGLVIRPRGSRNYTNITARGLSSTDFYNPTVQVYVDGVPQSTSFLDQELLDIERVEFLRGPQGTLYGRNAYGGVLNIVTNRPREAQARASGTVGYPIVGAEATTTAVLVDDTVFADVAGRWRRDRGRIRDIDRNDDGIDRNRVLSGRASLRYTPADGPLDAAFSLSHEHLDSNEEIYLFDDDIEEREFRGAGLGPYPEFDRNVTTGALAFNYTFGRFTLSNVTSVQYLDLDRRFSLETPETTTEVFEELRLAFDDLGRWSGVAGLAAYGQWFTRDTEAFPGFVGASQNEVRTTGVGLFGEATYAVTDRFDVTAGARFAYDRAEIDFERADPGGFAFNGETDFFSVQPKIAAGYRLTDATLLYGLVSRGYQPGGFNRAVATAADAEPYDPETAWNFEIGGRTQLLGDRLELGAALYYIRSQDKQIFIGPLGDQVIRNVGNGESVGVEFDASLFPTDRLTIAANVAYGSSTLEDARDPATNEDFSGNKLPYAPDFTGSASLSYVFHQNVVPGDVTLFGAVTGFSRTYFDQANELDQPAYALFDVAVDVSLDNGVGVRLFADNVFDEVYRTSSFDFGGGGPRLIRSTIGEGRVVGLTLSAAF